MSKSKTMRAGAGPLSAAATTNVFRFGYGQLLVLTMITTLPAMAIVSLFPALPLLLRHFGDTPNASVLVPLIVTAPGICIALLSPIAGAIADRFGRRRTLLLALVLYGCAGSLPLFLDDLLAIIGSRLLLGVAEASLVTTGYALVADYFPPEVRARWLSIQAALGSCIAASLTFVGGFLADFSWRGPFLLYLVALPLFVACLSFIKEPKARVDDKEQTPGGGAFPWRLMMIVAAVTLFSSTIFYGYILQIGFVFETLGLNGSGFIGLASGVASLGVILGAFLYRACERLSIERQLFVVFSLLGIGFGTIGLASSWHIALIGAFVEQLGAGMVVPTLAAWSYRFLPFEFRNRGTGIWISAFFMGQFSCPLVVALVRLAAPDQQMTIIAFGAMAIAGGVVGLLFGRTKATI